MRDAVTEVVTVDALVSAETGHLDGAAGRPTALLVTPVQTVCLSVTDPGLRDTLTSRGTEELIGPAG